MVQVDRPVRNARHGTAQTLRWSEECGTAIMRQL
jgi:hypothetical protein